MSMLNFYINRAGRKMSGERQKVLERAKSDCASCSEGRASGAIASVTGEQFALPAGACRIGIGDGDHQLETAAVTDRQSMLARAGDH